MAGCEAGARPSRGGPGSAQARRACPASICESLDRSCAAIQEMAREEFIDDRAVAVPSRIVAVAIVGIELLVPGADPVEQRVARLGRTDIVLKPDVHDDRTGDLVGEV